MQAARRKTQRAGGHPRPSPTQLYSVFFLTSSLNSLTTFSTEWPATSVAFTPVALSVRTITAAATAAAIRTRATAAMTKRAKREKAPRLAGPGGAAGGGGEEGAGGGPRPAGRPLGDARPHPGR